MSIKLPWVKVCILTALIFVLFVPGAGAGFQGPAGSQLIAQNQPAGDVDSTTANQEAVEKLSRMTAAEIEALDKKLAEALVLYYDRDFARALPIFNQIADQVETMDVMFWIGTSAMQVGQNRLAVEKFKKMLAIDPQLHRVRLELARTYFQMGRLEQARLELEYVMAAAPPPGVQQNIQKMLGAIDEKSKKLFWNLRASLGFLRDDNVSSGPEQKGYDVSGGTFTPSTISSKQRDEAWVANVAGNVLYDIGEGRDWMWNTTFNLYNKSYFDFSEFNYLVVDMTTGPWLARSRDILKVPFGYSESEFGSDRLSYIFHVDPNYEYHFSPNFSLKGLLSYSKENFHGDERSVLDNENHRYELTPNFYFDNRRHIVSASVGYEDHNAKVARYSYADPYFACSYFFRVRPETELFLKYELARREYQGLDPFYGQDRSDKRHMYTAVVSQGFYKNFFVSLSFGFIENDSNLELYDYDKTTYAVNIGCRF